MTPAEHYIEAEQCMSAAELSERDGDQRATDVLHAQASIHAALTAAHPLAWPAGSGGGQ